MLLYTDVDFLGYQCHFCGILTDVELLDVINSCFQKSWGLLPCWIQENCHHLLPEQGRTPRVYYFFEGQTHWAAVQSGEGEGCQVKTAFVWRAGSQSATVIRKLWITTELSWQGHVREP